MQGTTHEVAEVKGIGRVGWLEWDECDPEVYIEVPNWGDPLQVPMSPQQAIDLVNALCGAYIETFKAALEKEALPEGCEKCDARVAITQKDGSRLCLMCGWTLAA